MIKRRNITIIISSIIIFSFISLLSVKIMNRGKISVNSFEECVAAGNPVMESYPRQCRTKGGKHFVEELKEVLPLEPNNESAINNLSTCEEMVSNLRNMLNEANYCYTSSDCTSKIAVGYPFECSTLVNNSSDINKIEGLYDEYASICNPPMWDCDRSPLQDEIECIENKCVDIRYQTSN